MSALSLWDWAVKSTWITLSWYRHSSAGRAPAGNRHSGDIPSSTAEISCSHYWPVNCSLISIKNMYRSISHGRPHVDEKTLTIWHHWYNITLYADAPYDYHKITIKNKILNYKEFNPRGPQWTKPVSPATTAAWRVDSRHLVSLIRRCWDLPGRWPR